MSDFSILGGDPEQTRQKEAVQDCGYCLSADDRQWAEETYGKITVKMKAEAERIGTMIPYTTRDGKYHDLDVEGGGLHFWTNGFWPGMLWQMYHATKEQV